MTDSLRTEGGRSVLRMQRRLAHPPERVWRALTEPGQLAAWFPCEAAPELRVGGVVRFGFGGDGTVTDLDPPRLLAYTWDTDHLRWELHADGEGTLLRLVHTFDDRAGAASFATGWHTCLLGLDQLLAGRPVRADGEIDHVALHDRYVADFGLDAGIPRDTDEGWEVRFERQLTRPAEEVWAALTEGAAVRVGAAVPPPFGQGVVTAVRPPAMVEHDGQGGGEPAGRVRWELVPGTGHGARLVLTHTGPAGAERERERALAAGAERIAVLVGLLA